MNLIRHNQYNQQNEEHLILYLDIFRVAMCIVLSLEKPRGRGTYSVDSATTSFFHTQWLTIYKMQLLMHAQLYLLNA